MLDCDDGKLITLKVIICLFEQHEFKPLVVDSTTIS